MSMVESFTRPNTLGSLANETIMKRPASDEDGDVMHLEQLANGCNIAFAGGSDISDRQHSSRRIHKRIELQSLSR